MPYRICFILPREIATDVPPSAAGLRFAARYGRQTLLMSHPINQRPAGAAPAKKRVSILVEFPDERLECVVVQWADRRPSVFVQLRRNTDEPITFAEKRKDMAAKEDTSAKLDSELVDFVDPSSGRLFEKMAWEADIVFSARAFGALQPEPDLVLPDQALWECREEALRALSIDDVAGITPAAAASSDRPE